MCDTCVTLLRWFGTIRTQGWQKWFGTIRTQGWQKVTLCDHLWCLIPFYNTLQCSLSPLQPFLTFSDAFRPFVTFLDFALFNTPPDCIAFSGTFHQTLFTRLVHHWTSYAGPDQDPDWDLEVTVDRFLFIYTLIHTVRVQPTHTTPSGDESAIWTHDPGFWILLLFLKTTVWLNWDQNGNQTKTTFQLRKIFYYFYRWLSNRFITQHFNTHIYQLSIIIALSAPFANIEHDHLHFWKIISKKLNNGNLPTDCMICICTTISGLFHKCDIGLGDKHWWVNQSHSQHELLSLYQTSITLINAWQSCHSCKTRLYTNRTYLTLKCLCIH